MNPQIRAADPAVTTFLTANAGSGKTSTLVNRVARLLLRGSPPEKILCVTYTKAAAAEMQARLFEQLGGWAVADDADLRRQLDRIGEEGANLSRARELFARALETPGGLRIQTIHAFCEKLLRRFPLEAGISPSFTVLDDLIAGDLARQAADQLLTLDIGADGRKARDDLILKLGVAGFEGLLTQFRVQHDRIREALMSLSAKDDWIAGIYASLELSGVPTGGEVLTAYAESLNWDALREAAPSLASGKTDTNQKVGATLGRLCAERDQGKAFDFDAFKLIFLTAKDEPRKAVYSKNTDPSDAALLDRLASRVSEVVETLKAIAIAENTRDALRLFTLYSALYTAAKGEEGALDFADLIRATRTLLETVGASWVLYKLDGGLDHILVDEAQDTSEDQWAIFQSLWADFFTGEGERTVFAVGDEKQSIYGFQGARPQLFIDTARTVLSQALAAGRQAPSLILTTSYRSLPGVLGFVDGVYADNLKATALNFTGEIISHAPFREDAPGCIELWPKVLPFPKVEATLDEDEDVAAVDAPSDSPPARRLAQQIARHIWDEIRSGRAVHDKGQKKWRPMHAGDVIVLVRSRNALFEHVIRELKMAGVPVSGADRLRLDEHIAFQDLRALMRVCLQPRDDLSLAVVLRSPVCDLSEDDLFVLAHGREGALWTTLQRHPESEGRFAEARAVLNWAVETAPHLTAFDFLSRALNRRDGAGHSLKQRFLTRLGDECEDVLDETLALALRAEGVGDIGLIEALDIFEYEASVVKREQEEGGRAVRVMTVHGSKGLEAPWVILPMAPQHNRKSSDLIRFGADGALYLCPTSKTQDSQVIRNLKAAQDAADDAEALRLFYVAATRARDRLTLCGYAGRRGEAQRSFPSWYDLSAQAFDDLSADNAAMPLIVPFDDGEMAKEAAIRRLGALPPAMTAEAEPVRMRTELPDFLSRPVPQEDIDAERWASISQLGDEDRDEREQTPSPLALSASGTGLGRFRRGLLIHKLFEILPDIDPARRDDIAGRYLSRQPDLDDTQRREIASAVRAVMTDARFAEAFGPHSRAEVAIAGQIGTSPKGLALKLSGRIDRLVVTADRVLVIDYKSNRPAPDRAEDAAIDYQRQMAGYVALLRQIHPGKPVEAALLWTDGPKLTPLSETLVNLRLGEILSR